MNNVSILIILNFFFLIDNKFFLVLNTECKLKVSLDVCFFFRFQNFITNKNLNNIKNYFSIIYNKSTEVIFLLQICIITNLKNNFTFVTFKFQRYSNCNNWQFKYVDNEKYRQVSNLQERKTNFFFQLQWSSARQGLHFKISEKHCIKFIEKKT